MLKKPWRNQSPFIAPYYIPPNRSENKPNQTFTLQKPVLEALIHAPSLPSPSLGCCFNKASQAIFDLAAVSRTSCVSSDKSWRKQRRPSVGSLDVVRFGSICLVLVIGGRDFTMVCTANWMPSCCPTSFTLTKTYIHWSYPNKTWDLEVILTIPQNGMYDMRKFTRSFTLISSTT